MAESASRMVSFAVIESASLDRSIHSKSELMMPVRKKSTVNEDGLVVNRKLYLANTEAFVRPCCVIPDYGVRKIGSGL